MKLYISSGNHFYSDVESRIERIENTIGEPDAIFIEDRISDHTKKRQLINWISAPILLISLNSWLVFLQIISLFFQSDGEIADYFDEEYGLEPYPVDKPVHKIIADQTYGWGIANWSLAVMPVTFVYFPFGLLGIYFALFVLITGAISVMMAYLCGVNTERNVYMMDKIADIAKCNEYETACIITGRQHDAGLRELGHRYDGIDIVSDYEN